ncbi:NADase-type glycan-binding domain-containing protein [Streptomyces sp. NPDC052236]|uniref:NADase-type glycan-binding domain-containing protein n=1 Tax=Streptomyces sp. NPDC052236 TaxID=3365686 RepID=UPI0037D66246
MSGGAGLICPDCGHRNAPGTAFCGSCELFLDWEPDTQGGSSGDSGAGTVPAGTVPAGTAPGGTVPDAAVSGAAVQGPVVSGVAGVAGGLATPRTGAPAEPSSSRGGTGTAVPPAGLPPKPAHPPTAPAGPPVQARSAEPRAEGRAPAQALPSAPAPGPEAGPEARPEPAAARKPAGPVAPVRPRTPTGIPGTVRRPGERPEDPADDDSTSATASGGSDTGAAAASRTVVHDLVCPDCSEPNPRTRTLCVRCGAVLVARRADEERLSWWERLLRRIFRRNRNPRRLAAGERPPGRAWRRPSLAIPLMLVLLLGGGFLARSYLSSAVNSVRDRTAKTTPVNPKFAEASSELKAHPASDAFDGSNNGYWAPAATGAGKGQFLEARFEQSVRLEKVIIHGGISANKDDFLKQGRPSVLDVELSGPNGDVEKRELKLEDKPGPQTLDLKGKDVRAVRFVIRSSFGAGEKNRHTAIAEVEFFGRR